MLTAAFPSSLPLQQTSSFTMQNDQVRPCSHHQLKSGNPGSIAGEALREGQAEEQHTLWQGETMPVWRAGRPHRSRRCIGCRSGIWRSPGDATTPHLSAGEPLPVHTILTPRSITLQGQVVDLYVPRKCSATNRLITAKDHASVQINVAEVDDEGKMTGSNVTYAFHGGVRETGDSDDSLNRCVPKPHMRYRAES